jgi:L-seryl-tRNA(Ser) seleniumtransferase
MAKKSPLDSVPLVEKVLQALDEADPPRPAIAAVVQRELAASRSKNITPGFDDLLAASRSALDSLRASRIQPVINGTGVLVHPDHGHPPLGGEVVETLQTIAANYTNLECDPADGSQGGAAFLEHNLALLCGAEAATAVNNHAAALLLVLRHFTARARKEVVVSRTELVQGGGSRIAEIVKASGATLRKAGTPGRTSPDHYHKVIGNQTAMILRAHGGDFLNDPPKSPSPDEIAALARNHRVPLVVYLANGGVTETAGLAATGRGPAVAGALEHGGDAACFNGGLLLGGPQAGIIAGSAKLVAALKKDSLFHALRCDKLVLSALQTTVDLHLAGQGSIPLRAMLEVSVDELQARARRILSAIEAMPMKITIGEGKSQIDGAAPHAVVPSVTLELQPLVMSLEDFAIRLRAGTPPVLGRIEGERFKLDLRTVFPRQDEALFRAILQAFAKGG